MTKRTWSIVLSAGIASLITFAPQAAARTATSVTVAQEARETLQEMRGLATAAAGEASQLQTFSENTAIDPVAHRDALMALKRQVNTMDKEIASLNARRESLAPWERETIATVSPLLNEAAVNTERATEYYNGNSSHLWTPEYRAFTAKIESDSARIATTLKDHLKYEKLRQEEQQVQSAIEAGGF